MSNIGLYYPFIAFQNDTWVKLAALYWDKLGRIALPEYKLNDSETVQALIGELDFIRNFHPSPQEMHTVEAKFHWALKQHRKDLMNYYSVPLTSDQGDTFFSRSQSWPPAERLAHEWSQSPLPQQSASQLAYIFPSGRIAPKLQKELINLRLALPLEGSPSLLGIHPRLAFVYMEALAEEMAANRQLHPLTESVLDHLTVSGYTLERLVQALVNFDFTSLPLSNHEIEVEVAMIALQFVLPRDIGNVPIKKIIKLRKQYSNEFAAFQTYLQEFIRDLSMLQDIKDAKALELHLQIAYEKKVKPQLDDLRACMKSLGLEIVTGAMNIRVALPALVTSGGAYIGQNYLGHINPLVVGAGAVAFSVLPVIQEKRKTAKDIMRGSPVAYLLRIEEDLKPNYLMSWVAQNARELFHSAVVPRLTKPYKPKPAKRIP